MPPPKSRKELQSFLGTINYLGKFSLATTEVCELLIKAEWSWNGTNQNLYDKAKRMITRDACMKFYDALKPLYLETDASGIGIGDGLLQMTEGMNCGCLGHEL